MTTTTAMGESMTDNADSGHCGRRDRKCSAWRIAAIVIGFLVFWPIGLALLLWTLWDRPIRETALGQKMSGFQMPRPPCRARHRKRRPNNTALANFLSQEQERLKAEQNKLDELVQAFEAFKQAERRSADQKDFDAFLQQHQKADDQ